MLSLGQCIIISLASTIYLGGAAVLLTGCSIRSISTNEDGKVPSEVVGGAPYFCPVTEHNRDTVVRAGTLPGEGGQTLTSYREPGLDHRATGHTNGRVGVSLLVEPLCMN